MRKLILLAAMFISMNIYGQDTIRMDTFNFNFEKGSIVRNGTHYARSTFIEIYEVITDSIVYSFGLEYKYSDSSFVRKVQRPSCDRKIYDMMKATSEQAARNQEKSRKETIEFLNRHRASEEVWRMFKLYGLIKE